MLLIKRYHRFFSIILALLIAAFNTVSVMAHEGDEPIAGNVPTPAIPAIPAQPSINTAYPTYIWYLVGAIWITVVGLWIFSLSYNKRSSIQHRLIGRMLIEGAILLLIAIVGFWSYVHFIPLSKPVLVSNSIRAVTGDTIRLSKESQLLFGIKTVPVATKLVSDRFTVNGVIKVKPESQATITAPLTGQLSLKRALSVGTFVKEGEVLANIGQVLSVADQIALGSYKLDQSVRRSQIEDEAEHSRQRLAAANLELERVRKLYLAEAVSLKQLQEAEQKVVFANTEVANAARNLKDLNEKSQEPARNYALKSPLTGIITAINAINGEQVEAGKTVITMANISTVWLAAQVLESSLSRVMAAEQIEYRVMALGNQFHTQRLVNKQLADKQSMGKQSFTVGSNVDSSSHILPVYFEIPNENNLMRDGMAAEVLIESGGERPLLTVPQSAVVDELGQPIVFVYHGGETFERRVVKTGKAGTDKNGNNEVTIETGLEAGERVVVDGTYQLRTLKMSLYS